jgi:hypothetical protein
LKRMSLSEDAFVGKLERMVGRLGVAVKRTGT